MALLGNGTADNILSGVITSPTRWSFSFHYRNASAPGGASTRQVLVIDAAGTGVCGFAWDHVSAGFQQSVYQRDNLGSFVPAKLTTSLQANTDYIIGGRYDGTNISAWLNGIKETEAAIIDPSTPANTKISLLSAAVGTASFDDGQIDFPCVWSAALSDGEMASLGKGFHPTLIRPASIIEGADLIRNVTPYRSIGWTLTGTTVQPSSRIIMPSLVA